MTAQLFMSDGSIKEISAAVPTTSTVTKNSAILQLQELPQGAGGGVTGLVKSNSTTNSRPARFKA